MMTIDFGPAITAHDTVLTRNALVKRVIYAIAVGETATALVANTSGQIPIGLAFDGLIFWYDATDTSSAHDGVSVLVTSDGYRYRATDLRRPRAVLASGTVTPPGTPAIGDAYLTGAAPTGAWATHGNEVAIYTRRGWVFVIPAVGDLYYVRDGSNAWVYRDEAGNIVSRFANTASSIRDGTLIGGQRRYIVESQTVNTPPGSPALGVYWIIGSAPTGAWAGQAAKIATSYDGTTWTIISPVNGLEAFDRALGGNYIFRTGLGWLSAAGSWTGISYVRTASGATTAHTSGSFWGTSDTPATTMRRVTDDVTLAHRASQASAKLRVKYEADVPTWSSWAAGGASSPIAIALFRDAETSAVAWQYLPQRAPGPGVASEPPAHVSGDWLIDVPDAALHTYQVAVMFLNGAAPAAGWLRRTLTIEETQ
jgi:hypothetical protein